MPLSTVCRRSTFCASVAPLRLRQCHGDDVERIGLRVTTHRGGHRGHSRPKDRDAAGADPFVVGGVSRRRCSTCYWATETVSLARPFNGCLDGEKFDPEGRYVRRWVPEIAALNDKYLFAPWTAPDEELKRVGIQLGHTYPRPIVEHDAARKRALAALETLKSVEAAAR